MRSAPIILVPGWWLGGWAWDDVVSELRGKGHDVTALTLPGLESKDADRSSITFADHVDAIVDAIRGADSPVVLAVHSGAGYTGYAASDRVPDRIAVMVYVDSTPGKGAAEPDLVGDKPMVWQDIEKGENLDGLTEEHQARFRERAVPEPGGVLREGAELTNDARRDIPTVIVATGYSSDEYKDAVTQGYEWMAGVPELRDVTWVDLPTSHWVMWSKPKELAQIIGDVASRHAASVATSGRTPDGRVPRPRMSPGHGP